MAYAIQLTEEGEPEGTTETPKAIKKLLAEFEDIFKT